MLNTNLPIIEACAEKLGPIIQDMVLVGGCAAGLLANKETASPARATHDIDTIIQMTSRNEYYELAEQLHKAGFKEDMSEGAPICRWRNNDIILDVMPSNQEIFGFGNRWYAPAIPHAISIPLPSGKHIKIISAPYFLLTKFEAVADRGREDYFSSHDLEDIIYVLDSRSGILDEISNADADIRQALSKHLTPLLENKEFTESISGHMLPDSISQARTPLIMETLRHIAANKWQH